MSEQEAIVRLSIAQQERNSAMIMVEVDEEGLALQITGLGMQEDLGGVQYIHDVLFTAVDGLSNVLDQNDVVTTEKHEHKPVQHRDGKEPWCNECQLNAEFKEPKTRFAPKPGA